MRNTRAVLMIAISVLMGLAAVIVAARWLSQQANLATHKVVVATRDIQLGSPLSADMMRSVDWPSSSRPTGAASDGKALEARVVRTALQRGEPILESRLAPAGTRGGLSSLIGDGKRAVSVRVNEVIGVAGFALPGSLVDVMVNTKDDADKPLSKIVLEQILVLAIAQEASRDETKPKVVAAVTLELTPGQAERLDLARSVGTLSRVLRNQLDKRTAATTGARKSDLLQVAAPEAKAAPRPAKQPRPAGAVAPAAAPKRTVEMIKGAHKTSVEY
jgi:pilus assembly protein CpaB